MRYRGCMTATAPSPRLRSGASPTSAGYASLRRSRWARARSRRSPIPRVAAGGGSAARWGPREGRPREPGLDGLEVDRSGPRRRRPRGVDAACPAGDPRTRLPSRRPSCELRRFERTGVSPCLRETRNVASSSSGWRRRSSRVGPYPEREINVVLGELHDDHVTLRRLLVDEGCSSAQRASTAGRSRVAADEPP